MGKDEERDAHSDCGIGHVEHRLEEFEMLAAPDRQPLRQAPFPNGEVEHVHHRTVEERCVAAVGRKELRRLSMYARTEEQSVEGAVDDVAQCTGEDQCHADHLPTRGTLVHHAPQPVTDGDHRSDAQQRKDQLARFAAEFHPEGHAPVLDEEQVGPIARQGDGVLVGEGELHPHLQGLVRDQDQEDDEDRALHRG